MKTSMDGLKKINNKYAKIFYKQTVLVQLIVKDMVTFFGTQCSNREDEDEQSK